MSVTAEINDRISKCKKILDQDPNSQIFAALAEGHRKKGDLDHAFRICQNGLRIHPDYGSAHIVMAKINLDRGLYDWAEAEVKRSVEIDGSTRAIELLLAEIHIYKGEFNKAIKLLKKLHEIDPANSQIKKLLDIARKIPEEQIASVAGVSDPTRIIFTSSPEKTTNDSQPVSTDDAKSESTEMTVTQILSQTMSLPEIMGAQFINGEGLVVESEWTLEMNATESAATLSDLGRILSKELLQASFGKTESVLIENNEHIFYLIHVLDGVFLFVGDANANLGGIRMKIGNLMKKFAGYR